MASFTFEQGTQADATGFVAGDRLTFSSLRPTDLGLSIANGTIGLAGGGRALSFNQAALGDGTQSLVFAGPQPAGLTLLTEGGDTLAVAASGNRAIWGLGGSDRITVTGDAFLRVEGGAGDDVIDLTGATGPARAHGDIGSDTITGGSSNDHLYGNTPTGAGIADGGDRIFGGAGNDYIQGNAGGDRLYGGLGGDRLYGGADDDELYGEDGQDYLQGNRGNDDLFGGAGNDILRGGQGDDELEGGDGGDQLFGDLGNDELKGGLGIDAATGGAGSDDFEFDRNDALIVTGTSFTNLDTVLDYTDGSDKIDLSFDVNQVIGVIGQTFADIAAARAFASQAMANDPGDNEVVAVGVGADTYLMFNGAGSADVDSVIRLVNVTPTALTSSDFD